MTVQVSHRLLVRATFERRGRKVQEFKVTLHTLEGGPDEWLVRYETHGGRPHRHFRWSDHGPTRHRGLHSWPRSHAAILSRAIQDLKKNWRSYETRYDAWRTSTTK